MRCALASLFFRRCARRESDARTRAHSESPPSDGLVPWRACAKWVPLLCNETLSGSFCHAHLDDWPLNAQHRGFHFITGRERNQTRSGCADVSRVEALSAVRSRGVSEIFTRERYSLRTFSRAGRKAKTEPQFAQHSMA